MTRPQPRQAFTFVEVIVTLAILAVILGVVAPNLRFARLSQSGEEKLEAIHALRVAQKRIRNLVETGTAILYPPLGQEAHCMVLTDQVNALHILYLDSDGRLCLRARGGSAEVLVEGLEDLVVSQPFSELVELEMKSRVGQGQLMTMVVTGYAGNQFYGQAVAP